MPRFRDISIKNKLVILVMTIMGIIFSMVSAILVVNEVISFRKQKKEELSTLARVIGNNTVAALSFGDREAAEETLLSLVNEPSIREAVVFTREGITFASYLSRTEVEKRSKRAGKTAVQYDQHMMTRKCFQPIIKLFHGQACFVHI